MELLQEQIRSGRYAPDMYKLLANTAEKSGNTSEAYEALGNYYVALGEINTAIKHFEEALIRSKNEKFRELRLKTRIKQLKREMVTNRTSETDTGNYFDKPLPLVTK
jgi:predicted Zn-dependent protease